MALFYLVRHGEATYDHLLENGFWGFGRDFAPLSEKGMEQTPVGKPLRPQGLCYDCRQWWTV